MAISLLLVSPHKEFGEQLRAKCQRNGIGDLRVTDDFAEAIKITRQRKCPLAVLDSEMEQRGISIVDIGYALRQISPAIYLIVIESERGEGAPGTAILGPQATLPASFEFGAFQAIVNEILPDSRSSSRPSGSSRTRPSAENPSKERAASTGTTSDEYPWLQDVNRAAQHLTRLTLESAAQAALMTRDHQLWAYAGQFPRSAAQELADSIERHWDRDEKTDLLRFVRLSATNAEHMLYATRITRDMILALVFDSETPFSTIRSQASRLAVSLASMPPETSNGGNRRSQESDSLADLPHLSTVLADVPLPDPLPNGSTDKSDSGLFTSPLVENLPPTPVREEQLTSLFAAPVFSLEPTPSNMVNQSGDTEYEIAADNLAVDLEPQQGGKPVELQTDDPSQLATTRKTAASRPDEARPGLAPEGARRIVLEPASPAVYNLDYACLLIPRFEQHYLAGDLTDRLAEWMQQTCVAFGWRLEYIAVRPDYLQWIASVPPAISPSYLMRIVRQQTSDRIFVEFPRFHRENPSGDFWAPGYLIMGGGQPHPQKLIKDFIKQTRQRQGIIRVR